MSQLLRDVFSFGELEILSESKGAGPMRVRGLFQEAEKKNGNRRIYAKSLIEREVNKLQPLLAERRLVGELDHPKDEVIHLTNASHLVTGLHMEGNKVIGEAEILNTPSGKVLQELLSAGVKTGVSSRAVGGLTYDADSDSYNVNENLKLITWDMVSDPSCQGAFPGLVSENQILSETQLKAEKEISAIRAEKVYLEALKLMLNRK